MEYFRLLLLVSFAALLSATSGQINIKAVIGENKILPCRAENRPIRFLEWRRTDIKEGNVLRYRGQVDRGDQHQSFKNRVIFQDREMKDGDVSLVLINVTMNDAGTYKAVVVYHGTKREKKLICSIHLHVAPPPPPPPGSFPFWAIALLVIAAVLVLILSGFLFHCLHPKSVPQVEEEEEEEEESVLPPEELHQGRDGDNSKNKVETLHSSSSSSTRLS